MAITSKHELKEAVSRVDADLQAIQDYLGRSFPDSGRVRFPRGYLRRAIHFYAQLQFLRNDTLQRNISYTLILSDIFHWLLCRTDLSGVAREMVVKELICLSATICESMTKTYLKGTPGGGGSFKKRNAKLFSLNIIDEKTKDELDWLWDTRNAEHLFLVANPELGRYSVSDGVRAVKVYKALRECLEKDWEASIPF